MMSHKKIHRFLVPALVPTPVGALLTIAEPRIAKQVTRVLKLQPGESIQVFADGGDSYTGTIEQVSDAGIALTVTAITPALPIPRTVIAAVAIVKGDAFEIIVQKLTELGVHTIVPLITGRTIKQSVRLDRLQAISDEALEQCGGTRRVLITEPLTIKQCAAQFPFESIVLDPVAEQFESGKRADSVVCYIGPEGGWNEKDEEILHSLNPRHLQITNRVLRTETAAIVGAYQLLWQ